MIVILQLKLYKNKNMKKIQTKNPNKKGFTLLELLIVVAIIGLLASLILVGLASFRTRGRDARRVADLKQVQNGLEVYYTKNLEYPCNAYSGDSSSWSNLTSELTTSGIGIRQVPQDPLGESHSYGYATPSSSDCQSYVLRAQLEDLGNNILVNDIDDTDIYGVDCSDGDNGYYCVQF